MASQSIVLRYRVQYIIITLIIGPSFRIRTVPREREREAAGLFLSLFLVKRDRGCATEWMMPI